MKNLLIGIAVLLAIIVGLLLAKPLEHLMVKMKLEDNLSIMVNNKIPLTAEITENPTISINDELNTTIDVKDK